MKITLATGNGLKFDSVTKTIRLCRDLRSARLENRDQFVTNVSKDSGLWVWPFRPCLVKVARNLFIFQKKTNVSDMHLSYNHCLSHLKTE